MDALRARRAAPVRRRDGPRGGAGDPAGAGRACAAVRPRVPRRARATRTGLRAVRPGALGLGRRPRPGVPGDRRQRGDRRDPAPRAARRRPSRDHTAGLPAVLRARRGSPMSGRGGPPHRAVGRVPARPRRPRARLRRRRPRLPALQPAQPHRARARPRRPRGPRGARRPVRRARHQRRDPRPAHPPGRAVHPVRRDRRTARCAERRA